jgi:hypothetical protein
MYLSRPCNLPLNMLSIIDHDGYNDDDVHNGANNDDENNGADHAAYQSGGPNQVR